jgi:uncharacterized protein
MIKRLPWLRKRKKTEPEPPVRLPIACGPVSNGEAWWPDTPRKQLIRKLVLEKADEVSRREGIDRREFLASSCGMATTLYMINLVNGCSSQKMQDNKVPAGGNAGGGSAGNMMGGSGAGMGGSSAGSSGMGEGGMGGYSGMTPDAMVDPECADMALGMGGDELIIDMQSHFANAERNELGAMLLQGFIGQITTARFPWIQRTEDCSSRVGGCYDRIEYIDQILMGSDTTIGVLSGISYSVGADGTEGFAVLNNEDLLDGAMKLQADFPGRILTHAMVMPNDRIDVQLAMMDRTAGTYTNWKTYPPWSPATGSGYWLDGMDDPNMVGPKMLQKGIDLGSPIFCIHKGFPLSGFSPIHTNPRDVGVAANMFPQAHFVIYHSAFEHGLAAGGTSEPGDPATVADCGGATQRAGGQWPEGPYDEENAEVQAMYPLDRGVNSLIKALRDNNIGPNGTRLDGSEGPTTHVYAETGGVWPNLMTGRVEEAMHYWGKLLLHIGEDRIVWGTDCLWFGSPQPAIQAFRCFEISQQFQDTYGYPALTPARKAKILGLNAAKLQNIRPGVSIQGCKHSDIVPMAQLRMRRDLDGEFGPRRDMVRAVAGPRTRREFMALARAEHQEKLIWSGRAPSRGWNRKI